jgi:hypothetical protein
MHNANVRQPHSRFFVNRTIMASGGGQAGATNRAAKARVRSQIEPTGLTPWVLHKHLDYPGAADAMPAELTRRYGRHAQELEEEETIDLLIDPLKAIAAEGIANTDYSDLDRLCPQAVLLNSRSDQAGQKPPIARGSVGYIADRIAASFEDSLNRLDATGEITESLRRSGVPEESISRRVRIAFIAGMQGGTGTGSIFPAAVIATTIARNLGIPVEFELHAVFNYRSTRDEEEVLRSAIGAQASEDIEQLQRPGRMLSFKSPQGVEYTALTPLFDRVFIMEGHGTLKGNAEGLALSMGEALAFRATSLEAARINTAHAQNILGRSRNF